MKLFIFLSTLLGLSLHGQAQSLKVKLTDHTANVETVAYSQDGRYFASSGWDGVVNLYTFDSAGIPRLNHSFFGHLGAVTSLCFSANNKFIVSCGKDFSARVWNIAFPDSSRTFNVHFEAVTKAFLEPSGKMLVTSSTDGTIKNTSMIDPKKSRSILVGKSVNDVQMSKDYKFYYVAVKGGNILKIETSSTKTVEELAGHKDDVNTLDLSTDGRFLASGSSDKTIIIWDLAEGKEVKKLTGFEWKVTSLDFSHDGKYIIGGCNDGTTKLFDVATGKLITDFSELSKNVRDVAFNPLETQIAIATNLDTDKYGALIFNSGVAYAKPEAVVKPKDSKPVSKTTGKTTKPAQTK